MLYDEDTDLLTPFAPLRAEVANNFPLLSSVTSFLPGVTHVLHVTLEVPLPSVQMRGRQTCGNLSRFVFLQEPKEPKEEKAEEEKEEEKTDLVKEKVINDKNVATAAASALASAAVKAKVSNTGLMTPCNVCRGITKCMMSHRCREG